jgi:hypothetical protein
MAGSENIVPPPDHKVHQETGKNGNEKQGCKCFAHQDIPPLRSQGIDIAIADSMKGNNAEINGFLKINGLIYSLDRLVKTDTGSLIIKDGKYKDQNSVSCYGYE